MNSANWKIGKPKKSWACAEVEQVLWDYPGYKIQLELQQLEPNCIAQLDGMPHGSEISDTTAKFGIRRAENDTEEYYQCQRVEKGFALLHEDLQELCERYYFCKERPFEIADKMNISYRYLWELKHQLIYTFQKAWKKPA